MILISQVDGSDITMYIVTGLSPGSSYGIQIASVIGVMEGERSEILWIVTDEDSQFYFSLPMITSHVLCSSWPTYKCHMD